MALKILRTLELAEICTMVGFEKCRAANIRNTVRDETWQSYVSEARPMAIAHEARCAGYGLEEGEERMKSLQGSIGGDYAMYYIAHNVDQEFFSQYLYARSIRGLHCLMTRCALLKAQEVFGCPRWAGSLETITETDGAEARATAQSSQEPPVGSITEEMLGQLLQTITHKDGWFMKAAMTVQFGAALRYNELENLRVGDVKEDGIYLRHAKNVKARFEYKTPIPFKKIDSWPCGKRALAILHTMCFGQRAEVQLFPSSRFTLKTYNEQIKAAAAIWNWTETVRFRGSHSLRHGGVGKAHDFLKAELKPDEIAKALLMSPNMVEHYRASNAEKHKRAVIKEEKRQEWIKSHIHEIDPSVWSDTIRSTKRDRTTSCRGNIPDYLQLTPEKDVRRHRSEKGIKDYLRLIDE